MTRVAIVFHSQSGRTQALAEAVGRGVRAAGVEAEVMAVGAVNDRTLAEASAIVFGCPTYMGSASAQFKAFMDASAPVWALQGWRDKLAAGFTHSSAPSGDKLGTLTQLAVFAAQHGMVWLGLGLPPSYASSDALSDDLNRLGSHLGAMAQTRPGGSLSPADLRTAEHLGKRVAEAARRWGEAPRSTIAHRHPTTVAWAFPDPERAPLALERVNLRDMMARPERFEHHLVPFASLGGARLEVVTASEPLYFAHVNVSDEYAMALPSGDDLVDRFLLRTFVSDPQSGADIARYNHHTGDLVLHPFGAMHWPGRMRPPYEPFAFPPGMRRCGLSLVYCASRPTAPVDCPVPLPADRASDVKAYADPPPRLALGSMRGEPGVIARVGQTSLELLVDPKTIAPAHGGFVLVLAASGAHAPCDLVRIPKGAVLDASGIERALLFTGTNASPDPTPASWTAAPTSPLAPYEEQPPSALPFERHGVRVEAESDTLARITIGSDCESVPRFWLTRLLFRLALHGLRLGYVETYGGLFFDDREADRIVIGLRPATTPVRISRNDALAFIADWYRAVAPSGYRERSNQ